MKKLFPLILIILTGVACQSPDWEDSRLPLVSKSDVPWTLSYVDWANPTILQLHVGENELRILNRSSLTRLDARGHRVESTYRRYHDIDLFSRPVFSHQFFLHKHSRQDDYFVMEVVDWGLLLEDNISAVDPQGYLVDQPPADDSSYIAFLNGAEPGAVNAWGEFLIPAIHKDKPDRITLFCLDPYQWFRFDRSFSDARQWEVTLPPAAGMQLRRLKGLGDDFLVSTDQATFIVGREGTVTQLWEAGASHASEIGDSWFAEVEQELLRSTDQGTNWQVMGSGASRIGEGEYFVCDSVLIYAREDSLYQIMPQTGDLEPLNNNGLEGHQITAVASFADSIYVGTLTGLFTKSRHALQ